MSNIKIVNVRHWKGEEGWSGIYCGRGRAPHGMEAAGLGNPLKVGQGYAQGEAAAAYLPHLRERCRTDTHERRTVLALPGQLVGKSDYLHSVFVDAPGAQIGDLVPVRIRASAANSLAGDPA